MELDLTRDDLEYLVNLVDADIEKGNFEDVPAWKLELIAHMEEVLDDE